MKSLTLFFIVLSLGAFDVEAAENELERKLGRHSFLTQICANRAALNKLPIYYHEIDKDSGMSIELDCAKGEFAATSANGILDYTRNHSAIRKGPKNVRIGFDKKNNVLIIQAKIEFLVNKGDEKNQKLEVLKLDYGAALILGTRKLKDQVVIDFEKGIAVDDGQINLYPKFLKGSSWEIVMDGEVVSKGDIEGAEQVWLSPAILFPGTETVNLQFLKTKRYLWQLPFEKVFKDLHDLSRKK